MSDGASDERAVPGAERATLGARLDAGLARLDAMLASLVPDAPPHASPGALDAAARGRLLDLVALLAKWNRRYNLTAVRAPETMIGRHLLDSLALLPWLSAPTGRGGRSADDGRTPFDLLDVGSGAGLPVLPLAIARPDLACLSVEVNARRARFQRQATIELGLGNVTVREARIEVIETRARVVVSRAFAAPAEFLHVAAPRCAAGGAALLMLGRAEPLPEPLPEPFRLETLVALEVPGSEAAARHLAVCRAPAPAVVGSPARMDYTRSP